MKIREAIEILEAKLEQLNELYHEEHDCNWEIAEKVIYPKAEQLNGFISSLYSKDEDMEIPNNVVEKWVEI